MTEHHSDTSIVPHAPHLLALCQEVFDDSGEEVGVRTVAWALSLAGGWTVTVPADGKPHVGVWRDLSEVRRHLDVFADRRSSAAPGTAPEPESAGSVQSPVSA